MDTPEIRDSVYTRGDVPDEEAIRDAMGRLSQHDPARLNAVAGAVTRVLGFTVFSRRYAIAVLAIEALDEGGVLMRCCARCKTPYGCGWGACRCHENEDKEQE